MPVPPRARRPLVQLGLVQIDIAGSSQLEGPTHECQKVKNDLHSFVSEIMKSHGGSSFRWDGDGGAFSFATESQEAYNEMVLGSLEIVRGLPNFNDRMAMCTNLESPIAVRISADAGLAAPHRSSSHWAGRFINAFVKNERALSAPGTVSISQRIFDELDTTLRRHFQLVRPTSEIGCAIYRHPVSNAPSLGAGPSGNPTAKKRKTGRPESANGARPPEGRIDVFISWTTPRAKKIAQALELIIGQVFPGAEIYLSWDEEHRGAGWTTELLNRVSHARIGIVCATSASMRARETSFEVGILLQALGEDRVRSYLYEVAQSQQVFPLSTLRATSGEKDDLLQLLVAINHTRGEKALAPTLVATRLQKHWRSFAKSLEKLPPEEPTAEERLRKENEALHQQLSESIDQLDQAQLEIELRDVKIAASERIVQRYGKVAIGVSRQIQQLPSKDTQRQVKKASSKKS